MTYHRFLIVSATGEKYAAAEALAQEVKAELNQLGEIAHLATDIDVPDFKPGMVIAVGGDGTIMRAMKKYSLYSMPTFGINGGTLGFLAGAEKDDWRESLKRVIDGKVEIEKRLALTFTFRGVTYGPIANEVFLSHQEDPMAYRVTIDGEVFWERIEARGFMVATPTGSNAENFTFAGPPIFPTSRDVALTPMASPNPAFRAFTIPQLSADGEVMIEFLDGKYADVTVQLKADGQKYVPDEPVRPGESIVVRKDDVPLLLATFGLPQHLRALRKKGFPLKG